MMLHVPLNFSSERGLTRRMNLICILIQENMKELEVFKKFLRLLLYYVMCYVMRRFRFLVVSTSLL